MHIIFIIKNLIKFVINIKFFFILSNYASFIDLLTIL